MAGLEISGATRLPEEVARMLDGLMGGIAENAGEQAAVRARLLLDRAAANGSDEELGDPALFRPLLLKQAKTFIESSGGGPETHLRLVAACHLLVNMLRPLVEGTDDEYITTEYEDLSEGLDDLERLDISNLSLDNRLRTIFEEIIELSVALSITEPLELTGRQQKV